MGHSFRYVVLATLGVCACQTPTASVRVTVQRSALDVKGDLTAELTLEDCPGAPTVSTPLVEDSFEAKMPAFSASDAALLAEGEVSINGEGTCTLDGQPAAIGSLGNISRHAHSAAEFGRRRIAR